TPDLTLASGSTWRSPQAARGEASDQFALRRLDQAIGSTISLEAAGPGSFVHGLAAVARLGGMAIRDVEIIDWDQPWGDLERFRYSTSGWMVTGSLTSVRVQLCRLSLREQTDRRGAKDAGCWH